MKPIYEINSVSPVCNEENVVTTALLLAAGVGSRLMPLTSSMPKCLAKVSEISILERLVYSLRQHGFKRLVIVVGHLDRRIREFFDEQVMDLKVDYIVNPIYRTTNNIYSLWLARKEINEPFLLVESDLVFAPSLLGNMLSPDKIAVSNILPWMNGSSVTIDYLKMVTAFKSDVGTTLDARYKTVNIYSLSKLSWYRVVERLDMHVFEGRVNGYYESVFADMIADGTLSFKSVFFDARRWYEIDTLEDIHEASQIFPKTIADINHLPSYISTNFCDRTLN